LYIKDFSYKPIYGRIKLIVFLTGANRYFW